MNDIAWTPLRPDHRTLTSATADAVREAIQKGQFPPGSQLPPEMELISRLSVSRTTLREALRTLEEQGFIERRRGKGTYVRQQSIVKDLSINFGISEMITQAGLTPGTQTTAIRQEKAPAAVAAALQLSEGAAVLVVDRVRTANDRPVVWSQDFFAAALFGDSVLLAEHLEKRSLYQYLNEQLQIRIARGVAHLSPAAATAEMASKLGVRKGTALQCISQTDFNAGDQPVLFSIEYHLPDAFVFVINRRGPDW